MIIVNGVEQNHIIELLEDFVDLEVYQQLVYPSLGAGIVLTDGGVAWALGAVTQIVPPATIAAEFRVLGVLVETLSANDTYEIVLYAGNPDVEVGRVRITRTATKDQSGHVQLHTTPIDANSRIRAAVATASGLGNTSTISIIYHVL